MDYKKYFRCFFTFLFCFQFFSVYAIKPGRIKQLENFVTNKKMEKIDKVLKANVEEEKTQLLFISIKYKNIEIIKYLIEKGVDVNISDNKQNTPLMLACSTKNPDVAELLLQYGANVNLKNDSETPLTLACNVSDNSDTVKLLLKYGLDINAPITETGANALMVLTNKKSSLGVKNLIESGADVNLCDKDGKSALFYAILQCNTELVEILIENGAEINLCDKDGKTPLYYAISKNNKDIVKTLLDNKADIKINEEFWAKSALDLKDKSMIALLLGYGMSPNIKIENEKHEISLLSYVIQVLKDEEIATLLIKAGADVNSTVYYENEQHSLLYYSREKGWKEIEGLLIKYVAKLTGAEEAEKRRKEEQKRIEREIAEEKRKQELAIKRKTFDNFYDQVLYEKGIPLEIGDIFTISANRLKVVDRVVESNGYTYLVTLVSSAAENSYDLARIYGAYGGGFRHCFYINTKTPLNLEERTEFTTYERYVTNRSELKLFCAGKAIYQRNYQDVDCYTFVGKE